MTIALALLLVALLVYIVWCLLSAIFKTPRRPRLKRAGWSGAAFVAIFIAFAFLVSGEQDAEARDKGFADFADMRAAEKAGVTDAAAWQAAKLATQQAAEAEASRKAETDRQAAAIKAEADAKAAAARAEAGKKAAEAKAAEKQKATDAKADATLVVADAKEEACRLDLSCWGEKAATVATIRCPALVVRMAKHDSEWTDGWLETKFSRYRWADKKAGVVTVIGDKVKFQNGFGAWTPMIYECDVDPATETVLDLRVREGRL
jgi:hypothetical protein